MSDYLHWLLLANGLFVPLSLLLLWHSVSKDSEGLFVIWLALSIQGATVLTIANLVAAGAVWP